MVLFLAITCIEGEFMQYYVPIYIAKVVIVTAALVYFRSVWKEIKFEFDTVDKLDVKHK